jgi:hypothetical protein
MAIRAQYRNIFGDFMPEPLIRPMVRFQPHLALGPVARLAAPASPGLRRISLFSPRSRTNIPLIIHRENTRKKNAKIHHKLGRFH